MQQSSIRKVPRKSYLKTDNKVTPTYDKSIDITIENLETYANDYQLQKRNTINDTIIENENDGGS